MTRKPPVRMPEGDASQYHRYAPVARNWEIRKDLLPARALIAEHVGAGCNPSFVQRLLTRLTVLPEHGNARAGNAQAAHVACKHVCNYEPKLFPRQRKVCLLQIHGVEVLLLVIATEEEGGMLGVLAFGTQIGPLAARQLHGKAALRKFAVLGQHGYGRCRAVAMWRHCSDADRDS